jgi:CheY-like chemotaxis protein
MFVASRGGAVLQSSAVSVAVAAAIVAIGAVVTACRLPMAPDMSVLTISGYVYGDVREAVAGLLQNAGFVVRTAANGLEGLIAAYQMRPGVILMDVTMPVLGGIEATRLIKASEVTRHARVIAYTADPSLDSTLVQTLFSAVLQKPAPPDVVLATVQHVASL